MIAGTVGDEAKVMMICAEPVAGGTRVGMVAVIRLVWTEKLVMGLTELLALSSIEVIASAPVVENSDPEIVTTFPPNFDPAAGVTAVAVGAA